MEGSAVVAGAVACVGVVVTLIVILIVKGVRRERARQAALQAWATQQGWQLVRRPNVDWGRRMPGRNRRGVTVALSGVVGGRPVSVAEYQYTTTSSSSTSSTSGSSSQMSSSTTYHYVVHVVRLRRPGPTIAVYRRGALSRFGRSLFGDRATAIGYEPFDSVYRVVADDPAMVRSVLGGGLVAEHVAGRLPDWSLAGDELLMYATGHIGDPAAIPGQFAPLLRVADLIEAGPTA